MCDRQAFDGGRNGQLCCAAGITGNGDRVVDGVFPNFGMTTGCTYIVYVNMTQWFAFGCTTDGAGLCSGAGRVDPLMTQSRHFFSNIGITTNRTGVGGVAGSGASRCGYNCVVTMLMAIIIHNCSVFQRLIIVTSFNSIPLLLGTLIIDSIQASAVFKRPVVNRCDTVGDFDAGQACAGAECTHTNRCDAIRNNDIS